MRAMKYKKLYRLSAVIVFVLTVGCSTIKPTPEAAALDDARPWGAGPAPTAEEQYPSAASIAGLLRGVTR
jgi:hypothetical protein